MINCRVGGANAEPTRTTGYVENGGFRIRFTHPTLTAQLMMNNNEERIFNNLNYGEKS